MMRTGRTAVPFSANACWKKLWTCSNCSIRSVPSRSPAVVNNSKLTERTRIQGSREAAESRGAQRNRSARRSLLRNIDPNRQRRLSAGLESELQVALCGEKLYERKAEIHLHYPSHETRRGPAVKNFGRRFHDRHLTTV